MLHNTKNAVSLGRDLHPIIFALCLVYNTSQGKSQGSVLASSLHPAAGKAPRKRMDLKDGSFL